MPTQGEDRGEEQQEASAPERDASGAGVAEADSSKSMQWQEGEADGASTEAVHGSAEEEDRESDRREGGESRAAAGVSQQEGDDANVDDQWDEASHRA